MTHLAWSVLLADVAAVELTALPEDMQASFERIASIIAQHGLENLREPYVKPISGKLWEMRLKGKSGIARALYITRVGRRIIVLHVFIKKTQQTPSRAIALALKRLKDLE